MIALPNKCTCSNPSVYPKNWKTVSASIKIDWRIQYYFKDPEHGTKLIVVKRMNRFKSLTERRAVTKTLLEGELQQLHEGYNPIKNVTVTAQVNEVHPGTGLMAALHYVFDRLKCVHSTHTDIKSTLKFVEIAAKALNLASLPVKDVKRRHIKRMMDYCEETKATFTAKTFNRYRKNLGILFKELVELDAIESNIIRDISKQKTVRKIKKVLTPEECAAVSHFALSYDPRFYLLIHIFFHSGCRTTEIFRVKVKHVDLNRQTVLITVLKGNQPFEVEKPIKDIALPFWKEAMEGAALGDYVFSKGLKPGPVAINPNQATRRWKRHVKNKLGIVCDFYSLKHLNTDQITKLKGLKTAGLLNSHTSESTTRIYAVNETERMNEEIKKIGNEFGPTLLS